MNSTGAHDSRFLAGDWTGLLEEHDRWVHAYNVQAHYAHQERKPGRRSPAEVLSWVKTPRFKEEDLARAFFSAMRPFKGGPGRGRARA
jgi:hypothetical protein